MSNAVFPRLPGLTFDFKMRPTFSTIIQQAADRSETRIFEDAYPIWEFDLTYEFVRDFRTGQAQNTTNPTNQTELKQIVGFYMARQGSFDSFLLDLGMLTANPLDSQVMGAQIGTGDGVTTRFQLLHPYGEFKDEVQAPRGTVHVYEDGIPTTAFTVDATGGVVFTIAPVAGAQISADFAWYYRVRFSEDTAEWASFSYQFYECQTLKLTQVRL